MDKMNQPFVCRGVPRLGSVPPLSVEVQRGAHCLVTALGLTFVGPEERRGEKGGGREKKGQDQEEEAGRAGGGSACYDIHSST